MKKGFTLAEVLITLGIIGVVAAMTIPTLVSKSQQRQHVVSWRKAYSALAQGVRLMQADEATPDDFVTSFNTQGEREFAYLTALSHYMKLGKICHEGKAVEEGCIPKDYPIKALNGLYLGQSMAGLGGGSSCSSTLDGALICFDSYIVYIDVNGYSKPNVAGKDVFAALVDFDKYVVNPAKGNHTGWGAADGVKVGLTSGNGTCKKENNDHGFGCSYYYLHNMP